MSIFDFMTIWWSHAEYLIARLDWTVIFGAVLIVGAVWIFLKMTRGRGSFDFAQMFQGEDKRTSMAKFLGFIGGLTATWVIVSLTTTAKLTEGYFGLYLGVLVAGKVASEYVAAKKESDTIRARAGDSDPPPDASVDLSMNVKTNAAEPSTARRPLGRRAA